jgi:50S ribosomal protein L16 3-hydroxylase
LLEHHGLNIPVADQQRMPVQATGEISLHDVEQLRQALMQVVNDPVHFEQAVLGLLSEPKYPDSLPEGEGFDPEAWQHLSNVGATIRLDPAARLLYVRHTDGTQQFFLNGEATLVETLEQAALLQRLADGEVLTTPVWQAMDQVVLNDWLALGMLLVSEPD